MNTLRSFLLAILEFPGKILNLSQFIKERKALYTDFKIGDWVRYREIKTDDSVLIMMKDSNGILRELKAPTFVPTTAEHLFFTAHEPFEIVKVFIMPIATEIHFYFRFRNCDQGHPCSLKIRNQNVRFGKNTIEFVPGCLVEKVSTPSYTSKPP